MERDAERFITVMSGSRRGPLVKSQVGHEGGRVSENLARRCHRRMSRQYLTHRPDNVEHPGRVVGVCVEEKLKNTEDGE